MSTLNIYGSIKDEIEQTTFFRQAVSKDTQNFQITKDQGMYETYNAYWHNPNQANQVADFRAKAIEEKQVQVKQLSNHFKELTANKSTSKKNDNLPAMTQTSSEMDKALKDKLHQTGNGLKQTIYTDKEKPRRVGVIGDRAKKL